MKYAVWNHIQLPGFLDLMHISGERADSKSRVAHFGCQNRIIADAVKTLSPTPPKLSQPDASLVPRSSTTAPDHNHTRYWAPFAPGTGFSWFWVVQCDNFWKKIFSKIFEKYFYQNSEPTPKIFQLLDQKFSKKYWKVGGPVYLNLWTFCQNPTPQFSDLKYRNFWIPRRPFFEILTENSVRIRQKILSGSDRKFCRNPTENSVNNATLCPVGNMTVRRRGGAPWYKTFSVFLSPTDRKTEIRHFPFFDFGAEPLWKPLDPWPENRWTKKTEPNSRRILGP